MTVLELVATTLGAIGTTLGILTSFKLFLDERVRLKVSVQASTLVAHGAPYQEEVISWSVVNISRFPVTVNLVGIETDGGDWICLGPRCSGDGEYVRRLEPRDGYSLFVPQSDKAKELLNARRAWAATVCGERIYGSKRQGKALREWARKQITEGKE
jgi:hypothetical protein